MREGLETSTTELCSAVVYESYLRMKALLGIMNLSKTNNE